MALKIAYMLFKYYIINCFFNFLLFSAQKNNMYLSLIYLIYNLQNSKINDKNKQIY